jgi:hypothetical protein
MENEDLIKLFKKDLEDDVVLDTTDWKNVVLKDIFDIK